MRRGSMLLLAIWLILVLSIMVMSFSMEAFVQKGTNFVVQERYRANRLIDAGVRIAEVILLNYTKVADWSEDQDDEKLLEDDRWVLEKQDLKQYGQCTSRYPIVLRCEDDKDPDESNDGTVSIDIRSVSSLSDESKEGETPTGVIDINQLYRDGGDSKYVERWTMIFRWCNIPEELDTPEDGRINLWNTLIASWDDWRDEDDTRNPLGEAKGCEKSDYEDWYEEHRRKKERRNEEGYHVFPRNGAIPDVNELAYVRGFREYPEILYGGVINKTWEKDEKRWITVKGILAEGFFCTEGSSKVNVNSADEKTLITIPGVYHDADEDDALTNAMEVASAIIQGKSEEPDWEPHDKKLTSWPYKDWADMENRVEGVDVGTDAQNYFEFKPDEKALFKLRVTGQSMGLYHSVEALCYVKDSKIRYVSWNEEDKETKEAKE